MSLVSILEAGRRDFLEATAGITSDIRPRSGWSVFECIEHVIMAEERYLSWLAEGKPIAPQRDSDKELRLFSMMRSRLTKVQTPEPFRPKGRFVSLAEALTEFGSVRDRSVHAVRDLADNIYCVAATHPRFGEMNGAELVQLMDGHAIGGSSVIRAVIFDFGNVLCVPPAPEKIARAAEFCGLTEHAFLEAFWKKRLEYDAGGLTPLEYWSSVTGTAFAESNLSRLIETEVDFWRTYDQRPLDWIAALRGAGIGVGILSNLPRVLGEDLRAKDFVRHFDHVSFSYELLTVKPQAAIYHHALQGLGVEPHEALFLDDKLPNIHGAIDVGLRAELFTTWEDFLERDVPALYGLLQSP
jgi:putative hydrolase of the HAD superfamily